MPILRKNMNEQQINTAVWLFGRGASIASGLDWTEPKEWQLLDRDIRIKQIQEILELEMQKIPQSRGPYYDLLSILSGHTETNWKHLFITTNWDYLLEREISRFKFKVLPKWLRETYVFHLNGSIQQKQQENSSQFLLETDSYRIRKSKFEVNKALGYMIGEKLFVIIGMSFECEMDKAFIIYLATSKDFVPSRDASWVILDPNDTSLDNLNFRFNRLFPVANIIPINKGFQNWIKNGMTELAKYGVINPKILRR